jgi:hypothetical protein
MYVNSKSKLKRIFYAHFIKEKNGADPRSGLKYLQLLGNYPRGRTGPRNAPN